MKKSRLFTIHYAGGSCYSFGFLTPYLEDFDVISLELPGRGKRIREAILGDFSDAVDDLLAQIRGRIRPGKDIIYGHSLGAILGFYITARLENEGLGPKYLIVSGNPGPGIEDKKSRHDLPPEEFKAELRELGGMPVEVLENSDLYEFYEPILRADFKISESGNMRTYPVIRAPVLSIMGTREEYADQIGNWANCTVGKCEFRLLEGDHFFIHRHAETMGRFFGQSAL